MSYFKNVTVSLPLLISAAATLNSIKLAVDTFATKICCNVVTQEPPSLHCFHGYRVKHRACYLYQFIVGKELSFVAKYNSVEAVMIASECSGMQRQLKLVRTS